MPKVEELNDRLDKSIEKRDDLLKKAEDSFLKTFSKNIKTQIIDWASKQSKNVLEPLDFNFDSFYEHAFLIELFARINEQEMYLEFNDNIIDPFKIKYSKAISYALEKKPELFENIDIMQEEVRAKAFWVKKSTDLTVTEKLMKDLQKNLDEGGTYKNWLKDIDSVADKVGMGDDGWYSANVYRTNMLSFYNSGAYQEQMSNIENQPYWMYDGIADDRQSDICKKLDGKVFEATDPIWNRFYPPNHYQCRSKVIALSKEDLDDYGLVVSKETKEIKKVKLESFEGNPGNSYWKTLGKTVEKKELKLLKNLDLFNRDMWAKINNINHKELGSIINYMGGDAVGINESLRNIWDLTVVQKEIVYEMDEALKKLPYYKGEVFRSINIFPNDFDEFRKKYSKGEINTELSYTSGTIGDLYNEESNVQITFISKTARDTQYFNMNEMEVIFERGATFKVKDVSETKKKLYLLLEEI